MTNRQEPSQPQPRADGMGRLARSRLVAAAAILAAGFVTGCLPSGSRGDGSGSAPAAAGSPALTATAAPSGPTPLPSFVPPTPTPEPTFLVYVVKRGDSLNTIAHRFGTTARSIAFWNRSTHPSLDPESAGYRPDLLQLGWTLFLRPNDVVDEQELPEPSASAEDVPGMSAPAE
jgi:hypothetical protein